jgi:glucose/arabinose dehydrogenase
MQFPAEYKGSAFVRSRAHGTARSRPATKSCASRSRTASPKANENFATGFWISGERRAEVWGRAAALAVTRDGPLLVADDTAGTVWRIAYTGMSDAAQKDERKKDDRK